ncbi:hypothetical protein DYB37_007091 [Aphanomyces astaci]|uniref:Uncharacterized protein n=1 Tax=Aphanomyces astaci TaxID=112090 RepID=A0A3R7BPP6_APHAT|nr:hypothetical protein DYB37_007091 [Aphanomyces astaci]
MAKAPPPALAPPPAQKKNKNPNRIPERIQLDIIAFMETGVGFTDLEVAAAYGVLEYYVAKLRKIIPCMLKEKYGVNSLPPRRTARFVATKLSDDIKVDILTKKALRKLPSYTVAMMYGVTSMAIHNLRRDKDKVLRRYKLGRKDLRDKRRSGFSSIVPFDEEVLRWIDATPGCKAKGIVEFARQIAPAYGRPPTFKATHKSYSVANQRISVEH